ncbi:phage tail assembly chaperone [Maritalea myrionectae]|uniref:phage tail assembly chaperone n=1 Tax=Maritalea myrionectae TaxID=454601 RepID=UPI003CCC8D2A
MPDENGFSPRQHLAAIDRDSEEPEPISHEYLIDWFLRLSRRRPTSTSGYAPLTFEGIDAWVRLSGEAPEPWEIMMIEKMDDAWLSGVAEAQAKRRDANT